MVYRYLGSISMLTPVWSAFEYLSGIVVVGVHRNPNRARSHQPDSPEKTLLLLSGSHHLQPRRCKTLQFKQRCKERRRGVLLLTSLSSFGLHSRIEQIEGQGQGQGQGHWQVQPVPVVVVGVHIFSDTGGHGI